MLKLKTKYITPLYPFSFFNTTASRPKYSKSFYSSYNFKLSKKKTSFNKKTLQYLNLSKYEMSDINTPNNASLNASVVQNNTIPNPTITTASSSSIPTPFFKRIYKPIVWIDCEMTGLDHQNDYIIEICCIITDGNLKVIDEEGYESVIHCPKSVMDKMGQWCIDHHGESGLTEKVINSEKKKEQVDEELLAYIKKYIPDPRIGILAGNSVHMDRLFMLKDLPKVVEHLTYRIIDVSSIMEVCRRHNSDLSNVLPRKKAAHTAKADILESIEQLRFYTKHYLKSPKETRTFVDQRRVEIDAAAAANTAANAPKDAPTLKRTNEEAQIQVQDDATIENSKKAKN